MSAACLILKHHASSIIQTIKEETIIKSLESIPQQTEPFGIIQWIRHFFPIISQQFPRSVPSIIEWTMEKTISYQRLETWPEIGLEFIRNMLTIFKSVKFVFP